MAKIEYSIWEWRNGTQHRMLAKASPQLSTLLNFPIQATMTFIRFCQSDRTHLHPTPNSPSSLCLPVLCPPTITTSAVCLLVSFPIVFPAFTVFFLSHLRFILFTTPTLYCLHIAYSHRYLNFPRLNIHGILFSSFLIALMTVPVPHSICLPFYY